MTLEGHRQSFWQGKTVFITGASSGIGEALALALARQGARVGLFARRRDRLQRLADAILADPPAGDGTPPAGTRPRALVLPGDVARRDDVHRAVEQLEAAWGPVDVLIANAGISLRGESEIRGEAVARLLDVNVMGAVYALEAVLPGMRSRGTGRVVAVSSAVALLPKLVGSPAYAASKAAMSRYFEGFRRRLGREGIGVTVVYPGFVRTEMTAANRRLPFAVDPDEAARRIAKAVAQGRPRLIFPRRAIAAARVAQWIPARIQAAVMGGRASPSSERIRSR